MKRMMLVPVAAIALAGCGGQDDAATKSGAPLTPIAAPAGSDWTQSVAATPEGGFRMGNPEAPVKLVEYGSLTCGACANFSEVATAPLKNTYIRSGRVSWEFRPYLLFPTDPAISQLLRCQGAAPFFTLSEQLYADQSQWTARIQALPPAQLQQYQGLPPQQQSAALIRAAGLDQFFRQRGMPQSRIDACLADPAGLEALAQINQVATTQHNVTGTPTFLINNEVVPNAANWQALEPALREAIG